MEQTANYQLSQWDAEDRILREDFNANNAKLEQALAAQAEAQSTLAAQMANCGNCHIVTTTYTGTGTFGYGKGCTLTFNAIPLLVFVIDTEGHFLVIHSGSIKANFNNSINFVTWNGNSVSWYHNTSASTQFNDAGTIYYVFAFLPTKG